MAKKYFKTTTVHIPIVVGKSGNVLRFNTYDGRVGFLELTDPNEIAALDKAIAGKFGGRISTATAEEYEDWKKKEHIQPRTGIWRQELNPAAWAAKQQSVQKAREGPGQEGAAAPGGSERSTAPTLKRKGRSTRS